MLRFCIKGFVFTEYSATLLRRFIQTNLTAKYVKPKLFLTNTTFSKDNTTNEEIRKMQHPGACYKMLYAMLLVVSWRPL